MQIVNIRLVYIESTEKRSFFMTGGRVIYIDKRDINREYQRHMRQSQSKYLTSVFI